MTTPPAPQIVAELELAILRYLGLDKAEADKLATKIRKNRCFRAAYQAASDGGYRMLISFLEMQIDREIYKLNIGPEPSESQTKGEL
jgi:hypothetical protein